jgi:RHS repeat-associated protein
MNAIAPEDVGAAAAQFDAWLREISGDYLTLARVQNVASALPVVGNIMALVDVACDVAAMVRKYIRRVAVEILDWASLAINLIGVIPFPPGTAAARTALRPTLWLVRNKLDARTLGNAAGNLGEALISVLVLHLNDSIAGEIEAFVDKAISGLQQFLSDCADKTDGLADDLIDVLNRCIGNKPLFDVAPAVTPETQAQDPKTQSSWNRMLGAMEGFRRRAGNVMAAAVTSRLPDEARTVVLGVIGHLTTLKTSFRSQLTALADEKTEQSIQWLLKRLLDAVRRRKKTRSATVSARQGTHVVQDRPGQSLGTVNKQAPARGDANACKQCPAAGGTRRSISFATGAEHLTHTDFMLAAPLPIEWQRSYRSDLAAYDAGSLGARWLTPYGSRIDAPQGPGKKRRLVHHGADGRSHAYPWLEVGQSHRDAIEEVTLTRLSERLLIVDVGKPVAEGQPSPWRETYEQVTTCAVRAAQQGPQHFRLVSIHTLHGAAIGLRYDHAVTTGPHAGEQVLSDILSKQGEQVIAHVGVQPDAHGRIQALWQIQAGRLMRPLAQYTYDEHGDLVQAQDENAAAWRYAYADHLLVRYTDRSGRGTNLQYDGSEVNAKAIREWADDGSFDTRLQWDAHIRLTWLTDALGHETRIYYDIDGYTCRIIHPDQGEEWFFRDAAKNVVQHVHPDGSTDAYRHDEFGNLIQHVRADGSRVHFEYDTAHRLTGVLDAEEGRWKRSYDVQGRLDEEIDPLGHRTQYAYDAAGRPTRITDAKGGAKKLSYTADGRLASYTDCSGRTSRWEYDTRGRLVKATDAAGQLTRYHYTPVSPEALQAAHAADEHDRANFCGRLQRITHADDSQQHFVHDAEGRLLAHTDALDRRTAYRYGASGLIAQRIDALGHTLGYHWDPLGRLVELRNQNGRPYRFSYDPVGRLLQEVGFDGQATEYRYAPETGVLAEVHEGDLTTALQFDPMGRLTRRTATAPGQAEQVESFGYTARGLLAEARNAHSRLQWFHDAAGNLTREHHGYQGALGTDPRTAVWQHRYDELNQRCATTRPDGHTLQWLSYGSGHVHGLLLDGAEVVGFERDGLHREVHRLQGNGIEQAQRYDTLGRLLEQQLRRGGLGGTAPAEAEAFTGAFAYRPSHLGTPAAIVRRYSYDAAGQLDLIEDNRRGRMSYRYDPLGRLLQATNRAGHEIFAFDPAGNILPAHDAGESVNAAKSTKASALPKLLDNLLKDYAGTHYRYDTRGSLVERIHHGRRSSFEWDAFGRLHKALTPECATEFAYDPLGRRIAKRTRWGAPDNSTDHAAPATETHTLYGWDGDTLAFESTSRRSGRSIGYAADHESSVHYVHEPNSFVPLLQARRAGAIELPPTTDIKAMCAAHGGYRMELDPLWNGEHEAQTMPFTTQEIAYYQCDHLGTPQELTDHEGQVAWEANHKAWGQAKEAISEAARKARLTNPIRFQGQYFDEETGLHYNRHRYYDPHCGRFISKDPIGLAGGVNLHQYADNPIEWVDPLGLASESGDLVQKADTIRRAGSHPASRNQRTIAVGEDASGTLYAGSSNGFDRGQRAAAEGLGVRCVSCKGGAHAEENLIREVPNLQGVGTSSRLPCGVGEHNCRGQLEQRGVRIDNDK